MIKTIIADDESSVVSIIRHFIKKEGLPLEIVAVAENGGQALELISTIKPDLTFIDIEMPICSGLEIMRLCPNLNYIVITAHDCFHYAQQALRLGASDLLLKPIDSKQLIEAICRCIGYRFTPNILTNQILQYIHANYSQPIDLRLLGDKLHASPSHLARSFKKHTHLSIIMYINKLRIDKAIGLLEDKRLSIEEIAWQVGYKSLNNFYKYFKIFTKLTPARYRR